MAILTLLMIVMVHSYGPYVNDDGDLTNVPRSMQLIAIIEVKKPTVADGEIAAVNQVMESVKVCLADIIVCDRPISASASVLRLDQPEIPFPYCIEVVEVDALPSNSEERFSQLETFLRADGIISILVISQ
jgi:hypothetical protein